MKDGVLAARIDLVMMPVLLKGRNRLTCKDIEPLYTTSPLNEVPNFKRLLTRDVEYTTEKTITKDDCDKNAAHFAFHNYAELVCRETGYWDGDPQRRGLYRTGNPHGRQALLQRLLRV